MRKTVARRPPRSPRPPAGRAPLAALTGLACLALAACAVQALPSGATPHPTAILVAATNDPLRVPGSDGLTHLEYDLVFTNIFTVPVTVTSVEVLAPGGGSLLKLEGPALGAATRPVPAGEGGPMAPVPVRGTATAILDVTVPPGQVPARLSHKITYTFPPDAPGAAVIGSLTVTGPDLAVQTRAPVVLAPPLRGPGWFNLQGCCAASSLHRYLQLVEGGTRYVKPEVFAIDWVQLRGGQLFRGDGSQLEQWYAYGADVVAAAPGTVVYVRNVMPETGLGEPPVTVKKPADYIGNSVVVRIAPDVWATYAHLQTGSVAVGVGDRVTTGQPLGRLGNSGNSDAPHLHFQLADGPDNTTANSLPFVLDRYTRAGTVDPATLGAAATASAPPTLPVVGPPRPGDGTLPMIYDVSDFR